MMIDPKTYRNKFEDASLDKILNERDRIVNFMHDFENQELPLEYYGRDPDPEVIYFMNIEYLKEICDLIKIKMKNNPMPNIAPFLFIEESLSKFSDEEQKEFLEMLKLRDNKLYNEFMEWKFG